LRSSTRIRQARMGCARPAHHRRHRACAGDQALPRFPHRARPAGAGVAGKIDARPASGATGARPSTLAARKSRMRRSGAPARHGSLACLGTAVLPCSGCCCSAWWR
jgi:hypothetical protein